MVALVPLHALRKFGLEGDDTVVDFFVSERSAGVGSEGRDDQRPNDDDGQARQKRRLDIWDLVADDNDAREEGIRLSQGEPL